MAPPTPVSVQPMARSEGWGDCDITEMEGESERDGWSEIERKRERWRERAREREREIERKRERWRERGEERWRE